MKNSEKSVEDDLRLCEALFMKADRARQNWEEVVSMTFPEIAQAAHLRNNDYKKPRFPLCGYARQAVLKCASAHVNYLTPMGERWFSIEPWAENKEDDEYDDDDDWYTRINEIMQNEYERSNFYSAVISFYLDRVSTGTAMLLAEADDKDGLFFTCVPAGTFAIAENNLQEVDTAVRKFMMTPAQMADEFGVDNLPQKVKKEYENAEAKYTTEFEVYQLVVPRVEGENASENLEPDDMPWRSVYIEKESKTILLENGYYEFPFVVSRFIRYGNNPYGRSALESVQQDIKDLLVTMEVLNICAQKRAQPPYIVSADLAAQFDPRAGGMTIISDKDAAQGLPRELGSPADTRGLIEQLKIYRDNIDDATFVSIMQTITNAERQMTATEVASRESEKIMTFSQSFTQFIADFRPLNTRVFCLLFRMGKFSEEDMPSELKRVYQKDGVAYTRVLPPKVAYIGRMAQALKYAQMNSLNNTLMELVTLAKDTGNPEFLMPLNIPYIARFKLNTAAVPYKCTKKPSIVNAELQQMKDMQKLQAATQITQQQTAAERNAAAAQASLNQ